MPRDNISSHIYLWFATKSSQFRRKVVSAFLGVGGLVGSQEATAVTGILFAQNERSHCRKTQLVCVGLWRPATLALFLFATMRICEVIRQASSKEVTKLYIKPELTIAQI